MGATSWTNWGKDKRDCRDCRDARKGPSGGAPAPVPLVALYPDPGIHVGSGEVVTHSAAGLPTTQGSVEVDYTPDWGGATPGNGPSIFSTFTNTTGIFIGVQSGTMGVFIETAAYNSAVLTWVASRKYHIKLVWGGGNMALYRDGVLIYSVTDGSVPALTAHGTFYIGGYFGVDGYEALGTIANLNFYAA